MSLSPSSAFSARPSWTKPMVAFTTATSAITAVSTQWPMTAVMTAAPNRT